MEVLAATNQLHQAQVRVVNIIAEFHRGILVINLEALHQEAMESQATVQAFDECLEALMVDQAFHSH